MIKKIINIYNKMNNLVWDNKLPELKETQINFFQRKHIVMQIEKKGNTLNLNVNTNFIIKDDETLQSVILHEMIHIEQIVTNKKLAHNNYFKTRRDNIKFIHNVDVSYKLDSSKIKFNTTNTSKEVYVIQLESKDFFTCRVYNTDECKKLLSVYKKFYNIFNEHKIKVFKTYDKSISNLKIGRSLKTGLKSLFYAKEFDGQEIDSFVV